MKSNIVSKWKAYLIIALIVILAGMVVLGVFGLNNSVDYGKGYEARIEIESNVNGSAEVADKAAKDYFKSVSAKVDYTETQTLDDGATVIYKLDSLDGVDETALDKAVKDAIAASEFAYLNGGATIKEVTAGKTGTTVILYAVLALGIAAVVIFIYALIAEKVASGVAVLVSMVVSALLYASLVAVTRLPADAFFAVGLVASVALGAGLSLAMCNRFKETARMVTDEKLSVEDVANKGAAMSFARFNFAFFAMAVAAVSFAALGFFGGATALAFVGAQILVAAVASYYAAFTFTPMLYAAIKKNKR